MAKTVLLRRFGTVCFRLLCAALYCCLAAFICCVDLRLLINVREFAVVCTGTVLLTGSVCFSGVLRHSFDRPPVLATAAWNAVVSGMLTSLILILGSGRGIAVSGGVLHITAALIIASAAPFIRPVVYGLCISFALRGAAGGSDVASNVVLRYGKALHGDGETDKVAGARVGGVLCDSRGGAGANTSCDCSGDAACSTAICGSAICGSATCSSATCSSAFTNPDPFRRAGLTKREAQIARMAASGLTNAEIGDMLYIAPVTVKTHMEHILQKTNLPSRTRLAEIASRDATGAI